jgi:hypothetical protein
MGHGNRSPGVVPAYRAARTMRTGSRAKPRRRRSSPPEVEPTSLFIESGVRVLFLSGLAKHYIGHNAIADHARSIWVPFHPDGQPPDEGGIE